MIELKDSRLKEIKEKADKELSDFIRQHTPEILREIDRDLEYQIEIKEVPTIYSFDNYLLGLKQKIRNYALDKGFPEKDADIFANRLTQDYKNTFYYSWLPNLSYNELVHHK